MTHRKHRTAIISWSTILALVVVWFAATQFGLVPGILLPSPARVWQTFINISIHGYNGILLWQHYWITMQRLLIAVVFAIVLGIPLGLLSGYIDTVKAVVDPIIQFVRPIPPLAYYTLLILWLGIGETSKVTLLFLAALPPIYLACYDSVRKVKEEFLQNAASLGADRKQVFRYIILPASMPDIFTGVRSAVGVAYTTIVSAEMIAASSGVGWMIIDSSHYLKSDVMFVGIILLGLTGVLLDWLIRILESRVVQWRGKG